MKKIFDYLYLVGREIRRDVDSCRTNQLVANLPYNWLYSGANEGYVEDLYHSLSLTALSNDH